MKDYFVAYNPASTSIIQILSLVFISCIMQDFEQKISSRL